MLGSGLVSLEKKGWGGMRWAWGRGGEGRGGGGVWIWMVDMGLEGDLWDGWGF